ncbi:MAG: endolytic transglycosylase MltG [Gammaproteobacteria bacterium]|nr:endolytic transglycosylase MltG [Gammaproteobacteria bacterium]
MQQPDPDLARGPDRQQELPLGQPDAAAAEAGGSESADLKPEPAEDPPPLLADSPVAPRTQRLVRALAVLLLFVCFGLAWLWQGYRVFLQTPLTIPESRMEFALPKGTTPRRLAQSLADRRLTSHPGYFLVLFRLNPELSALKAGTYQLEPGMTPEQALRLFVSGRVKEFSLTVIEGWSFRQLRDALSMAPRMQQTLAGLTDTELMARLGKPGEHPEGRFFPDTYRYPVDTSDAEVLQRAYAAMSDKLSAVWAARAPGLPYRNAYEALTMASIVEKETGQANERPQIAGVFVRRLQQGMRLDTDPTVIYGLGTRFDGNLRKRDLQESTPYNTYQVGGLPPTPIALPGEAALRAAVQPASGKSLYFVARGDGSHQFSDTLAEHNTAVRKYQLKQ